MPPAQCPYCYRPTTSLNRHIPRCSENPNKSAIRVTWDYSDQMFLQSDLVFTTNSKRKKPFILPSINTKPNGQGDFGDLSTLSSAADVVELTAPIHKPITYKQRFQFSHENIGNSNTTGSSVDSQNDPDDFLPQDHDDEASTGMLNPNCGTIAADQLMLEQSQVLQGSFLVDESDYQIVARKSVVSYTRIFDVLNRCKVPLVGYDAIVNTIASEVLSGRYDPCYNEFSRKSYLSYIQKRFPVPTPIPVQVRLENQWNLNGQVIRCSDLVEVVTFDFKEQLEDILSDPALFGDVNNLVINKDDHDPEEKWRPYKNSDGILYEVLDGNWYQNYGKKTVTDPTTEFCVPIGLYIDASQTDKYSRFTFQPLVMFPLILNGKARNRKSSSRVIALLPDLDAKSSAVKAATRAGAKENFGTPMRNYHKCMDVALSSLKKYQKEGGITAFLRLGDEVRQRRLKIPVAFILGDAKSQDTLSGRFLSRNSKRITRACNCKFVNSDRAGAVCKFILADKYTERIDVALNFTGAYTLKDSKKALKSLHHRSVHAVRNAFSDIDFAGYERGIYGCTPHDLMHLFLEGVLKYCTRLMVDRYTTSQKAQIDTLVTQMFGSLRSSEKKSILPRASFIKGMTNLTMITADEEAGMALTLLIIGLTNRGRDILDKKLDDITIPPSAEVAEDDVGYEEDIIHPCHQGQEHEALDNQNDDQSVSTTASFVSDITAEPNSSTCSYRSFIQVVEMMLAFHAWYKSKEPMQWGPNSYDDLMKSLRCMLRSIKMYIPREEGNGWHIQKFHELLHVPIDVMNFGSPNNFDTGRFENRLIDIGKINSVFCQKWTPKLYTRQLSQRIAEQQCFSKAKRCLGISPTKHDTDDDDDDNSIWSGVSSITNDVIDIPSQSPSYCLFIQDDGSLAYQWLRQKKENVPHPILAQLHQIMKDHQHYSLFGYTEVKILGKIFRCHPNYRSRGPWYDWAIMRIAPNHSDTLRHEYNIRNNITPAFDHGCRPAKVLAIFQMNGQFHFLYHVVDDKRNSSLDSVLAERWNLRYHRNQQDLIPYMRYSPIQNIIDSAFVVEECPDFLKTQDQSTLVVLVKKKKMWKHFFTDATDVRNNMIQPH